MTYAKLASKMKFSILSLQPIINEAAWSNAPESFNKG